MQNYQTSTRLNFAIFHVECMVWLWLLFFQHVQRNKEAYSSLHTQWQSSACPSPILPSHTKKNLCFQKMAYKRAMKRALKGRTFKRPNKFSNQEANSIDGQNKALWKWRQRVGEWVGRSKRIDRHTIPFAIGDGPRCYALPLYH